MDALPSLTFCLKRREVEKLLFDCLRLQHFHFCSLQQFQKWPHDFMEKQYWTKIGLKPPSQNAADSNNLLYFQ
jgi:hypothetical protein